MLLGEQLLACRWESWGWTRRVRHHRQPGQPHAGLFLAQKGRRTPTSRASSAFHSGTGHLQRTHVPVENAPGRRRRWACLGHPEACQCGHSGAWAWVGVWSAPGEESPWKRLVLPGTSILGLRVTFSHLWPGLEGLILKMDAIDARLSFPCPAASGTSISVAAHHGYQDRALH